MATNTKAAPYCSNRMFEWCAAVMMTQCGLFATAQATTTGHFSQIVFSVFVQLGLPPTVTGLIFFVTGAARIAALARNGKWKNGPLVRATCAIIGAVVWGQLMFGVLAIWVTTGSLYLSLVVWNTMLVFESMSFSRALNDRRGSTARGVESPGALNGAVVVVTRNVL